MFRKWLLCICICLSCLALTLNGGIAVSATEEGVEAPPPEPTTEEIIEEYESGYEISASSHINDNNLYSYLLKLVREDMKAKYDIVYEGTVIYSEMFKDFTEIVIDDNLITTLKGLDLIKFDNLKTLKITNNKLTEITEDVFENMPVIETLDFTSNDITSVNFGQIPTLKSLTLNNNKLTHLDLTELGSSSITLNLAQNKFSDMLNIKFPERITQMTLNIINNNITNISDDYFAMDKLKMCVGIQNINDGNGIDANTTTPIRYYKTNIPGLSLKVFKFNGVLNELVYTFEDSNITGNAFYEEKTFGIGNYSFEYYFGETPAYVKDDPELSYYKTGDMNIKPSPCTIQYEFKGKTYYTFDKKVTGKVKVMLSSVDNGEIMYKVNGGEWQKGSTIMCDKGGNYSIYTKVVIDGVESEENVVLVRTSQNVLIPDIVMLVLVLLFTFGLFMIVVPYISKKFFKK